VAYVFKRARGFGALDETPPAPGCFAGYGPPPPGQQFCPYTSDSITVSAKAEPGPLCFSGWLFPWVGRPDYNPDTDAVFCNDLLNYNGIAFKSPWPAVVTAGIGLLVVRALFGGGGRR